jgi:hypothetical protein
MTISASPENEGGQIRTFLKKSFTTLKRSITVHRAMAFLLVVVLISSYWILFWSSEIDAFIVGHQTKRILGPLDRKIDVAESSGMAAARGLKDQRGRIIASAKNPSQFSDGYHRFLLPINRSYVDKLRRLNPSPVTQVIERVAARLNFISQFMLQRDADRGFLYGVFVTLLTAIVGIFLALQWWLRRKLKP